jgi:hypothetical protein
MNIIPFSKPKANYEETLELIVPNPKPKNEYVIHNIDDDTYEYAPNLDMASLLLIDGEKSIKKIEGLIATYVVEVR